MAHFKMKHGTVADLLHDSTRLYDSDFDKRIPSLEEMNELLEEGYFDRTAYWDPFTIDIEEYREVVEHLLSMKLNRPYVYINDSEWELYDMIEAFVLDEALLPAKIYSYKNQDHIMMKLRYGECVIVESADNYSDALELLDRRLEECGQRIIYKHEKNSLPKGLAVRKKEGHFIEYINSIEREIKCESDQEGERVMKSVIKFYKVNDEYGCFSNFSKHPFELEGKRWATSEIYFQAKKFEGTEHEEIIRSMTNSLEAAKYGRNRKLPLRTDWEDVKDEIMRKAVIAKFSQNEDIKEILLQTGNKKIIEATTDDYYWGCGTDGTGKNMLGEILMEVRQLLRDKEAFVSHNCPRCRKFGIGAVYRAKVKKTNEIIYICEECDLTYDSENTSDIIISAFDTYAEKKGIEPLWSELELLD